VGTALVFAYDSLLAPESILEIGARGAASLEDVDHLAAPYDERAGGFFPGEAAAALVLQPDGAPGGLCRIEAASAAEGGPGEPSGAFVVAAARRLGGGVEVIDGCALARPQFDAEERTALGALVGPGAALTATAAATGQLGAAMSLVQTIALGSALLQGQLPPIARLARPVPGPLRPLLAAERTSARVGLAVSAGAPGLAGAVRVEVP